MNAVTSSDETFSIAVVPVLLHTRKETTQAQDACHHALHHTVGK